MVIFVYRADILVSPRADFVKPSGLALHGRVAQPLERIGSIVQAAEAVPFPRDAAARSRGFVDRRPQCTVFLRHACSGEQTGLCEFLQDGPDDWETGIDDAEEGFQDGQDTHDSVAVGGVCAIDIDDETDAQDGYDANAAKSLGRRIVGNV